MTYRILSNLADVLRAGGCNVIEYDGWQSRGRPTSTGDFDPTGILCHHTASPDSWSDQDDINCILGGNSSAPGPISQLYQSRHNPWPIYVLAAGRANHGGKGRIPGQSCDDMNARLLGIEAGQSGSTRWPDEMIRHYAKVCAALMAGYGWPLEMVLLHSVTGPPCSNFKIDPSGPWFNEPWLPLNDPGNSSWSLDAWQQFVAEYISQPVPPPSGDDDMPVPCGYITCNRGVGGHHIDGSGYSSPVDGTTYKVLAGGNIQWVRDPSQLASMNSIAAAAGARTDTWNTPVGDPDAFGLLVGEKPR